MADTKEKLLYFMDRLVLSALEDSKEFDTKPFAEELLEVEPFVEDEFKAGFDKKLASVKLVDDEVDEGAAFANLVQGKFADAANIFAKLLKKDKNNVEYVKALSNCLLNLSKPEIIVDNYVDILKKNESDDKEVTQILANSYFGVPDLFAEAIPYFERLTELVPNNFAVFYQLGYLYERVYQNRETEKQIKYIKRAHELAPNNNLVMAFLAKLYFRTGQRDKAVEYFEKMMKNNPTPEEQVLYSRMFMQEGDLKKSYDMYRVRFQTSNVAYPRDLKEEKRWDGKKDLSNSTVIVHYEQGFGDSVMFCRYIHRLAKLAKKVIVVIQKNLIPILKSSGFEEYCELLSHEADINPNIKLNDSNSSIMYTTASGMSKIPHDYHIPMMDFPYLFDEAPDKMLESEGYLRVDKEKVEEFRKKYIKDNSKFKVGLSYHGTNQSNQTFRDVHVSEFLPLFRMKDVEFYSFQADEYASQLEELPKDVKVHNLGKKFKNFEDTACAMECMDLVISTDNVVMNLAGAMGKKAFGLFNVYSESRWYKTVGEDIGWYKSVKPFKAKNFNEWQPVIEEIKKEIEKIKTNKIN